MSDYLARKIELQRMAAARREIRAQLDAIDRQIADQAEAEAIATIGGKSYCFGRRSTSWRPTHQRAYLAHSAHLRDRRAPEIEALARKVMRQTAAIEAYARRLGLNIDADQLLGRNLRAEQED